MLYLIKEYKEAIKTNKIVSLEQVRPLLKDGMSIMIGGFLACGTLEKMIELLVETNVNRGLRKETK